jgi:hypothetical protein
MEAPAAIHNQPSFQPVAPSRLTLRQAAIPHENGKNLQMRVFVAS